MKKLTILLFPLLLSGPIFAMDPNDNRPQKRVKIEGIEGCKTSSTDIGNEEIDSDYDLEEEIANDEFWYPSLPVESDLAEDSVAPMHPLHTPAPVVSYSSQPQDTTGFTSANNDSAASVLVESTAQSNFNHFVRNGMRDVLHGSEDANQAEGFKARLLNKIVRASSVGELESAVQCIARLKCTCKQFDDLFPAVELKKILEEKLNSLGYADLNTALDRNAPLFILKALLYTGEKVNQGNIVGKAPIHTACRLGRNDALPVLLDAGAYIERSYLGRTPLMECIKHDNQAGAIQLLSRGANVNKQVVLGRTALHIAVEKGNIGAVHMLLAHGANPALKCKNISLRRVEETALGIAIREGHQSIVSLLQNHAQAGAANPVSNNNNNNNG